MDVHSIVFFLDICMPLLESMLLSVFLRSFFLCYPGEALEGPISTWVIKKTLNNIDSNNGIQISKKNTIQKK